MRRYIVFPLIFFIFFCPLPGEERKSLSLSAAIQKLGAGFEWDAFSGLGAFVKGKKRVVFREGEAFIYLNGWERKAVEPVTRSEGSLVFASGFLDLASSFLDQADEQAKKQFSIAAVLIDPGHGGKDTGAVASHQIGVKRVNIAEKDVTLSVSRKLYELMEKKYPGKKVFLTREGDTYPSLEERVEKANGVSLSDNDAIIYISIHANASFNKKAKGFEVWYLSPDFRRTVIDDPKEKDPEILPILNSMLEEEFTTESIIIAKKVMEGLVEEIGMSSPNRGIKAEEWFVVRNAKMPSVLIELGFVTNPDEAALLSDDAYLKNLSEGIYNGLVAFIEYFESSKGFTE